MTTIKHGTILTRIFLSQLLHINIFMHLSYFCKFSFWYSPSTHPPIIIFSIINPGHAELLIEEDPFVSEEVS